MSSGTSKIVESIMSEAQEKADVIIQDANAEVSAIQANAEKTAEAEKTKILENGKKQSDMRYQQIISEAKMNARRAELGAKEEVIEAAFNQAIGELKVKASSGDDEYEESLSKMILEATNELGSDDLILQLNEADTKKFINDLPSQDFDSFEIDGIKFKLGEPIADKGCAILKDAKSNKEALVKAYEGDIYETSLSQKIKEAADEIGGNDLILHLNEADTNKFEKQLPSRFMRLFKLGEIFFTLGEPIDMIAGAVIKEADGDKEIALNASFKGVVYETSLANHIKEAADEIGSDEFILHLSEADYKNFKEDLSLQGTYSFNIGEIKYTLGEPIDVIGGAVLKTADGDIEVNNTIEARLDRFKSILRSEVAEILFK